MRIDHINLSTDVDEFGQVRSASIWFENTNALGERISGQFAVQMLQYEAIQRGELTPRKIAEQKLTELLEVKPDQDATAAIVELRGVLDQKSNEVQALSEQNSALQQMIVELTLMLSMIGQPELPTDPDPQPPVDPDTPVEESPTETPEEPPVEDPPQEDPDISPEEGAPDDPEPETPADPVADDPDTTPIDEGGQGGE